MKSIAGSALLLVLLIPAIRVPEPIGLTLMLVGLPLVVFVAGAAYAKEFVPAPATARREVARQAGADCYFMLGYFCVLYWSLRNAMDPNTFGVGVGMLGAFGFYPAIAILVGAAAFCTAKSGRSLWLVFLAMSTLSYALYLVALDRTSALYYLQATDVSYLYGIVVIVGSRIMRYFMA